MEVIRAWGGNKDIGIPIEQKKRTFFFKELGNPKRTFREQKRKEEIFVCPVTHGIYQR